MNYRHPISKERMMIRRTLLILFATLTLLFTLSGCGGSTPAKEVSNKNDVTLYGVTWCIHCKNARQYFKTKGIAFKDYNPEESAKHQQEFDKLGGTGYPLIYVNGVRIVGFDEEAIAKALH